MRAGGEETRHDDLMHAAEPGEANRFSSRQEIPGTSWNPKVHYHIHKCSQPIYILSQFDPLHILTSHFLKIHLVIILPSKPGFHQWSLSPQVSTPKPCIHHSTPYALHAPPISFFSILSPEQYHGMMMHGTNKRKI
jgi:hypothetical protein